MEQFDTIAAISTAVSESGIGIIRISGPECFRIADELFVSVKGNRKPSSFHSHTIHYGWIREDETDLDEVLLSVMRAPHTYTAEDTVEINCHGSVYALTQILKAVIRHGARPAQPGEFTKRAFLNGRIDLSRAEAVMDVIQAKNEYALKSSMKQLKGFLYEKIHMLRGEIVHELARIEAALDDPEHYTLEGYGKQLTELNQKWIAAINGMLKTAESGRIMKEGIRCVIIGRPNAGKSSLLNMLSGQDRAIVTDIRGTTRDILTETIQLGNMTLLLSDTAGIRESSDPVEKIGVDRALKEASAADLLLCVIDSSEELDENDLEILRFCQGKKTLFLMNKSDLPAKIQKEEIIRKISGESKEVRFVTISAKKGEGLETLRMELENMFFAGNISMNDEVIISNVRQQHLLERTKESLLMVQKSLDDEMPEDFISIDLRDACISLGEITGVDTADDVVDEIFSSFCMGK